MPNTPTGAMLLARRRPHLIVMAGLLIASIATASYARHRYGSFAATRAVVSGQRIYTETPMKSLGEVSVGEIRPVEFVARNLTSRPIGIIGSRMSCTCTTANGLPSSLPAGETRVIRLNYSPSQAKPGAGDTEVVRLFTDDPVDRELILTFTARPITPGGDPEHSPH